MNIFQDGWNNTFTVVPEISIHVETIPSPNGDNFFPCLHTNIQSIAYNYMTIQYKGNIPFPKGGRVETTTNGRFILIQVKQNLARSLSLFRYLTRIC
ncbi:hypothetical protein LINGRAPRIM_LOCUS1188 [Linum grandiflorum]